MTNKAKLLQDFYDRVWISGTIDEAATFFDLDAEAAGLIPGMAINALEFNDFAAALLKHFKVERVTMEKTIENGDWIAVMVKFDGFVRATHDPATGRGMFMSRIVDSKIVEAYNYFDFLSFFETIGLVPENAVALCMAGQRLH